MKDKLIDIIYDSINSKNLYNYSNDEGLKDVEIKKFTNMLEEQAIEIRVGNDYYIIGCIESFKGGK